MRFHSLLLLSGIALSVILALPTLTHAQSMDQALTQDANLPCRTTETSRALDFWMGSWDVGDGDAVFYGNTSIEWDAGGCAIHEFWENTEGVRGTSLFYFDINADTWHQVWVSSDTSKPWGLKLKDLIEVFENGAVRFQAALTSREGAPYLDRTTLIPNDDGTVQQLIEISNDDGETWRTAFSAVYSPAAE